MDIAKIKQVIDQELLPDEAKRMAILAIIAMDKQALPDIIEILTNERTFNNELITDMNLQLSRSHIFIDEYVETREQSEKSVNKKFILENISAFYSKYHDSVRHCFNRFVKPG